jgi:hypothetical protein
MAALASASVTMAVAISIIRVISVSLAVCCATHYAQAGLNRA